MKSKEELNTLKEEVEALNAKLAELTDEELEQVSGGVIPHIPGLDVLFAEISGVIREKEERLR